MEPLRGVRSVREDVRDMRRFLRGGLVLPSAAGLALLFLVVTPAVAAFTCTTVARRLQSDPEGHSFSNVFRDDFDVNENGDVVFAAKAEDGRERLYVYRGNGTKEVVAEAGGPGPAGVVFRAKRPFADLHISFSGLISFVARDSTGRRVLVSRSSAGVWTRGDAEGDEKSGSIIKRIVSAEGTLYVADLKDGRREILTSGFDAYPLATTGTPFPGSIPNLCEIRDARTGLFSVMFRGAVCDPGEAKRDGIFSVFDLATIPEAVEGDPSPFSEIPFARFAHAPAPSGPLQGAFIASLETPGVQGIFSASGPGETLLVTGDAAPRNAGAFLKFHTLVAAGPPTPHFFLSARVNGAAKFGVFSTRGDGSAVLLSTDSPPADGFASGAVYRRLGKELAAASDGSAIVFRVKVRDRFKPRSKVAIIRCSSPSGAFLDGPAIF